MQTKFTHNQKDEHQKPKSDPQKSNEQNHPKQEVIPPGAKLVKISDLRTVHRRAEDILLEKRSANFYFRTIGDILQTASPTLAQTEWVRILGYGSILESVLKTMLKERYINENIPGSIDEYFRDYSSDDKKDPSKRFYNDKKHSKSIIQFVQALKTINRAWNASKHSLKLQTPAIECLRYLLEFISYTSGKPIPKKFHKAYNGEIFCQTLQDFDSNRRRRKAKNKTTESTNNLPQSVMLLLIAVDSTSEIKGERLRLIKGYICQVFAQFFHDRNIICECVIVDKECKIWGRIGSSSNNYQDLKKQEALPIKGQSVSKVLSTCLSTLSWITEASKKGEIVMPFAPHILFITDRKDTHLEELQSICVKSLAEIGLKNSDPITSLYTYDNGLSEEKNLLDLINQLLNTRITMLQEFLKHSGGERTDIPQALFQSEELRHEVSLTSSEAKEAKKVRDTIDEYTKIVLDNRQREQRREENAEMRFGAKKVIISKFRTVYRRTEDILLSSYDAYRYFNDIEQILHYKGATLQQTQNGQTLMSGSILARVLQNILGDRYDIDTNVSIDEYFSAYSVVSARYPQKRYYNQLEIPTSLILFIRALKGTIRAARAIKHGSPSDQPARLCLTSVIEFISYASDTPIPKPLLKVYESMFQEGE